MTKDDLDQARSALHGPDWRSLWGYTTLSVYSVLKDVNLNKRMIMKY